MKVKIVKCVNPQNNSTIMYRLIPLYTYRMTLDDLAENISRSSSINKADVMAVVETLRYELITHVTKGGIVEFGDLGTFKISISSVGHESPEQTSVSDIRKKKVVFKINHKLRSLIDATKFEKIPNSDPDIIESISADSSETEQPS